jgi:hypothetical protein
MTFDPHRIDLFDYGTRDFPLSWSVGDSQGGTVLARLACLTAARHDRPLRVDGDLSDWPLGGTNVAGDFRLVSFRSDRIDPAPDDRPRRNTLVFVLLHQRNLYLAFHCESGSPEPGTASRTNTIHYEDGIPLGEELVEALIDPLNAGTRSPGDLHHLAIKRDGAFRLEKGVRFDPPCGSWSPWAADVEAAVGRGPRGWTAEVRIPLSAFEGSPDLPAVWGINFTRADAENQEFSTWSGAVRNAYDPLSLGNLALWP